MRMTITMSQADQKAISKYFATPGVLYQPGLGIIFGVNAGLILGQLLYWHGKGKLKDGWIFKTIVEMKKETGLSRNQQDSGIAILMRHGVIETKLAGVPAKRHFRLRLDALHEALPSLKKTNKLTYPNPPRYYVENQQTITKITRQNTSKNTQAPDKSNPKHIGNILASYRLRTPGNTISPDSK